MPRNPFSCSRQFVIQSRSTANSLLNGVQLQKTTGQTRTQPPHIALISADVLGDGYIIRLHKKSPNIFEIMLYQPVLPALRK